MATIIRKKPKKKLTEDDLRVKAFDLYASLNADFKHVYKLSKISAMLGVHVDKIKKWRDEGKWRERLDKAVGQAREHASNAEEAQQLLTSYLFGDLKNPPPSEVGTDPAKIVTKYEKKKRLRIRKVVKYLADVIFEVRHYNHLMFRALTAKKDSKKFPNLEMDVKDRDTAHKEYMGSLTKLMELFGVGTIKELAIEMLSDELVATQLKSQPQPAAPLVNINMTGPRTPEQLIEPGGTMVLDDKAHETILSIMVGGTKIHGPTEYSGLKTKNCFEGAEDAIISQQGRPDSEGED